MEVMSVRHYSVPRLTMHPHRILGAAMLPARKDARPRRNNAVRAVAGNCRGVLERLLHHRPLQHVAVRWRIGAGIGDDSDLGFRESKSCASCGDDEVEVRNHLEATAHGQAVDRSDDGLLSAPP
ncbi:hypothetical protein HG530_012263 [Fusarium avenaceum]|nr:hypothetical protein HG530_012263 [Fusarium avenaceum]